MSANIPNIYAQTFATTMEMLVQQKVSRLRSAVTVGSYRGKQNQVVDQIGAIDMLPVTSRFGDMPRVDAPLDSRWVVPSPFHLPQMVDSFDELKVLLDPKNKYAMNAIAAANRKIDDLIIAAFTAAAKTGETGSTSTSILGGNTVLVNAGGSGNTGLTVYKLRQAKKKLLAHEVDLDSDQIFCAVTAEEHDDLLAEAQVVSTDFNDRPVLVDGKIERFLGINFIHSERLKFDSGVIRSVPVWAKSGMHLGIWEDIKTSVSIRHDIESEPYQVYIKMMMGATRLEEKKIVQVLCDES